MWLYKINASLQLHSNTKANCYLFSKFDYPKDTNTTYNSIMPLDYCDSGEITTYSEIWSFDMNLMLLVTSCWAYIIEIEINNRSSLIMGSSTDLLHFTLQLSFHNTKCHIEFCA